MSQPINANRLFYASCFALITTAFSFSIRAGILTQLGTQLNLDPVQLGHINQMWFLGFPLSMIIGGIFYQQIGRGCRPGKDKLIVLDFVGNLERVQLILEMVEKIKKFLHPPPFEVRGVGGLHPLLGLLGEKGGG